MSNVQPVTVFAIIIANTPVSLLTCSNLLAYCGGLSTRQRPTAPNQQPLCVASLGMTQDDALYNYTISMAI
jgi:hypothetical protein